MRKVRLFFMAFACVAAFSACSYKNHLPPGEKLYLGADVRPESRERFSKKKYLKQEAQDVVRPKPNSKFLGMRLRLGIYNAVKEPKKKGKGLRHWLKYKVGEPPVLFSQVDPYKTSQFMDARLFNLGVFNVITSYELRQNDKSVKVIYKPLVHEPYEIVSIEWPTADDDLNAGLRSGKEKTLIKIGRDYNLDVLESERVRLDSLLKNKGFFYFSPDYILFEADTTLGNRKVALKVRLKDDLPYAAALVYRINDVYVFPDYALNNDTLPKADTALVDSSIHYVSRFHAYRPTTILRTVFIKKDDLYSRRTHQMTLNRVMGLGIFKYANIRYFEVDTSMPGFLNAYIFLTPLPRKSVRLEADAVSKSNNYVGPQLNLAFRNRNTFRGAETFVLNFRGTYETQYSGANKGISSYSFGPQIEYSVPRVVLPFHFQSSSFYQPRTRYLLSYEYIRRAEYFSLNSIRGVFGYKWRESLTRDHELNPIDLNYTRVGSITPRFQELLNENPLLRRSYQEQFIAGLTYTFNYNEQLLPQRRNQFAFTTNAELAGNALNLATRALGKNPNAEDPVKIAGTPFAQFARIEADARDYFNFEYDSKLAARAYLGVAKPYGNSDRIPFIRQFFSGGPNSVRAFRVRSLGPGSYREPDSVIADFFDEQGGDIKLEGNVEYRFPIYSLFKGAVFADAGNTWLIRKDTLLPGGTFLWNDFAKELGVGAGIGLRVDANFFVLRVDLAMPFRKPWLPEGDRWVLDDIDFKSPTWRQENLIFNIAIGYPF